MNVIPFDASLHPVEPEQGTRRASALWLASLVATALVLFGLGTDDADAKTMKGRPEVWRQTAGKTPGFRWPLTLE